MKKEEKRIWYMESRNKHTLNSVCTYLNLDPANDGMFKEIIVEGGLKVKILEVPEEVVEYILSDSNMNGATRFYVKLEEKELPCSVSSKDANVMLTGQHISDKAIPKVIRKSADKAFARKMLLLAYSKLNIAKEAGRSFFFLDKVSEVYDKDNISLRDMKGLDLAIVKLLKDFFPSLTVEKQRKNFYFKISLT